MQTQSQSSVLPNPQSAKLLPGIGSRTPRAPSPSPESAAGPSSDTITRIELSEALMYDYIQSKQAWDLEQKAMSDETSKLKLGEGNYSEALAKLARKRAKLKAIRGGTTHFQICGRHCLRFLPHRSPMLGVS